MADYIEREALLERLAFKRDFEKYPRHKYPGLESAIAQVLKAPTADVAPVVHGEWVDREDYYLEMGMTCSACGNRVFREDGSADFNYCPNCGVKMDGGKNDAADS